MPDLAIGWSWSEDGTVLTLPLRHGVEWHDAKPFTAAGAGLADQWLELELSLIHI